MRVIQRWWEKERTKTGGEGSCEERFRVCLFMFGMHPGVLFNDSRIGHGVSLVRNHKMEEERVRVRECECLQHYTVINL